MAVRTYEGSLSNRKLRSSLVGILRENVLASFATVSPRGRAHINTAYFAWARDCSLVFFSYPNSRHALNLAHNPSMAVTVFDSHQRWGRPDRGIQLFGRCRKATGAASALAWHLYSERFPGSERWRTESIREEGAFPLTAFRFRPSLVKIFDESNLGGGRFFEVRMPRRLSPRLGRGK